MRSHQIKVGYREVKPATSPHEHNKRLIIYLAPQVPCQLCGVPFKVGRIRTQFEERAAAWSADGDPAVEDDEGCAQDGCMLMYRYRNPED